MSEPIQNPHPSLSRKEAGEGQRELAIVLSSGGQFYAVLGAHRECGIWLSLAKHPLPVPSEWHRPGDTFAAVMRGRDYYRIGASAPQHSNGTKAIAPDDELVTDYLDASWWTPGLEEAWEEISTLSLTLSRKEAGEGQNLVGHASLPADDARASALAPPSKKKGGSRG